MIGRLAGKLIAKKPGWVLVDVGGVGYEVEIPLTTFYELGDQDEKVLLYTHMVIRDDTYSLFGFRHDAERQLFRALVKVNGVGPKLAIMILSGMDASAFSRCVHSNNIKSLVSLPGVGKKTAERLIMEMRDRLPEPQIGINTSFPAKGKDHLADAEVALIGLGFKPQEATRALSGVHDAGGSVENLIKHALKNLI